jgi:hypothetical protein
MLIGKKLIGEEKREKNGNQKVSLLAFPLPPISPIYPFETNLKGYFVQRGKYAQRSMSYIVTKDSQNEN